ncbi:MAG: hypothetical protein ACPGU0_03040, partial [Marinirhabdus sp.]
MKTKVILPLIFLSVAAGAQTTRKYSNEFMNIGVDAAAFGMANAVVAGTGDVNSGYWNPAGLVHVEDRSLALMHASYFANIANYDYAAYAMPLDKQGTVALSVIRFGVDDILNTTQLIDEQGKQRLTLSFYAYAKIDNPQHFRDALFLAWEPLEVL